MLLAASAPAIRCALLSMSWGRERERKREGASQKLERTAQGAGRTQRPPRSGLHMCVLKFQEDAGESQLLYSNWERRDFEREFGTRVEI
jgi:hypothetical protein